MTDQSIERAVQELKSERARILYGGATLSDAAVSAFFSTLRRRAEERERAEGYECPDCGIPGIVLLAVGLPREHPHRRRTDA